MTGSPEGERGEELRAYLAPNSNQITQDCLEIMENFDVKLNLHVRHIFFWKPPGPSLGSSSMEGSFGEIGCRLLSRTMRGRTPPTTGGRDKAGKAREGQVLIRFTSLILIGLIGGNTYADDQDADVKRHAKILIDYFKKVDLDKIRDDIRTCDRELKALAKVLRQPNKLRGIGPSVVEYCVRRAVLTETYVECWLFNSQHLRNAYEYPR